MATAAKTMATKSTRRPILRTARERNRLALQHAKLTTIYARKFAGRGLSYDDLVSEAWLGILQAAERFDDSRPEKFNTYAKFYIHRCIYNAIRRGRSVAMAGDPTNTVNGLPAREPTADPGDSHAIEAVREGLCHLSFNEARMLRLRHGIGFARMTGVEAARALGVSISSGDRIYQRAKRKLRLVIEGNDAA